MARGRPRTTENARKTGRGRHANNSEIVTPEQWAKMKSFGTFVVSDPETGESAYKFKRGDITAILPYGRNPSEQLEISDYWVGIIKDIRAEIHDDDMNTVWAKIQWYYSGQDVKSIVKSFDQLAVGKFERIEAEHEDIVGSESFESVVKLIKFDEHDCEQAFIPRDQFFCRYIFEPRARTIKPKPGSSGCTCLKPYNPDDVDPSSVMHFCPRPSCRRAYHQDCLLKDNSIETLSADRKASPSQKSTRKYRPTLAPPSRRSARMHASPAKKERSRVRAKVAFEEPEIEPSMSTSIVASSRALRLLACSPDTDDLVDLESLVSRKPSLNGASGSKSGSLFTDDELDSDTIVAQPPKKRQRRRSRATARKVSSSSQNQISTPDSRSLSSILSEIPSDLLQIAQQPMCRGGAFTQGGVSGNIGFVTRARRLVYKILDGEKDPVDLLEREAVPLSGDTERNKSPSANLPGGNRGTLSMLKWEAEVFGPDRIAGRDVDEENAIVRIARTRKALPTFVCPQCKSSI